MTKRLLPLILIILCITTVQVVSLQSMDLPIPCELEYLICNMNYPELWWLCELQYWWCKIYQS